MGPKTNKSAKSKSVEPVDSISTNESENDSDLNTDLFPENTLPGSPILSTGFGYLLDSSSDLSIFDSQIFFYWIPVQIFRYLIRRSFFI
jgi:hypothetical protein